MFAAFEYLYVLFGNIRFHAHSLAAYEHLNGVQFFSVPPDGRTLATCVPNKDKPVK